jgi:hypothetical protein
MTGNWTRWTAALWLASACIIMGATAVEAPPEDAIFMTKATEKEVVFSNDGERTVKDFRWVPTDEKIAFAWSDQPFAVHVPIAVESEELDVRGENTLCSLAYEVRAVIKSRDPGKASESLWPVTLQRCVYRLDGQGIYRLCPDARYDFNIARRAEQEEFKDRKDVLALPAFEFWHARVRGAAREAFCFVFDPRRPDVPWFVENAVREKINLALSVTVDIVPTPRWSNERPGKIKGRRRLLDKEFPITIRQNAWVLRNAKTTVAGDWNRDLKFNETVDMSAVGFDPTKRFEDVSAELKGATIVSKHRVFQPKRHGIPPTDVEITLELPPRVWDHAPTTATVRMREVSGDTDYRPRYGVCPNNGVSLYGFGYKTGNNGANDFVRDFTDPYSCRPSTAPNYADASRDPATSLRRETWSVQVNAARGRGPFQRRSGQRSLFGIPPSRSTLPNDVSADDRLEAHPVFVFDIVLGSYEWGKVQSAPRKRVELQALRLSAIEDQRVGQVRDDTAKPVEELPDDGYWQWRVAFDELLQKNDGRIDGILKCLEMKGLEIKEHRARYMMFLEMMQQDTAPAAPAQGDKLDQALAAHGKPAPAKPTITNADRRDLRLQMDNVRQQIALMRSKQQKDIEEGLRLFNEIAASVRQQHKKSAGRRPDLEAWAKMFQDREGVMAFRLYDAAGFYEASELPALVAKYEFRTQASSRLAKLMDAKILLAEAGRFERIAAAHAMTGSPEGGRAAVEALSRRMDAIAKLQDLVRLHPDYDEARKALAEQEVRLVEGAMAKLQEERRLSLADFQRFLKARGFDPYRPDTMPARAWEFMRHWWGAGPLSLMEGFSGVPDAQAKSAIAVQNEVARNHLALLAVRRLLWNGLTLAQVRALKTEDELRKHYDERRQDGGQLEPHRATELLDDIIKLFLALPELKALAEGNRADYINILGKSVYRRYDPDKSAAQVVGDMLFSPINLALMFGPSAICRVNQKWVTQVEVVKAGEDLAAIGQTVETTRDLILGSVGLSARAQAMTEYLVEMSKAGGVRGALAEKLVVEGIHARAALAGMDYAMQVEAPKLIAAMTIYGVASHAAENSRWPALRYLVDALAALSAEEEIFHVLHRLQLSPAKLAGAISQVERVALAKQVFFSETKRELQSLGVIVHKLQQRVYHGSITALTAEEIRFLRVLRNKYGMAETAAPVASGLRPPSSQETLDAALDAACAAAARGDMVEANAAFNSSQRMFDRLEQEVNQLCRAAVKARDVLKRSRPAGKVGALDNFRTLKDLAGQHKTIIPFPGDYPEGAIGVAIKEADSALVAADYQKAFKGYDRARTLARGENQTKLAAERVALNDAVAEASKLIGNPGSRDVAPAIANAEVQEIQRRLTLGVGQPGALGMRLNPNSANPVYFIHEAGQPDKVLYVFKVPKGEARPIDEEIFTEELCADLINACNMAHVKVRRATMPGLRNADGSPQQGILSRFVEKKELWELTEPEIFALIVDFSRIRLINAFLGNTDGHLRNLWRASGRGVPSDFGLAQIFANKNADYGRCPLVQIQPEFPVSGATGLLYTALKAPEHFDSPIYKWLQRFEGAIRFEHMEPTLKAIESFCSKKENLRKLARDRGLPANLEEAFVNTMSERAGVIRKEITEFLEASRGAQRSGFNRPSPPPTPIPFICKPSFSLALAA